LEIEIIVVSTFWIELRAASLAPRFALHILADRQLYTTGAAKYCSLVPLALWPDLDLVIGERCVAIFARIVNPTTLHLDRNHVGWSAIMFATGLRTEIHSTHIRKSLTHRTRYC
jgi:hypothetical protein